MRRGQVKLGSFINYMLSITPPLYACKTLVTLCVFRVVLGQKTPNSLRWVHLTVI